MSLSAEGRRLLESAEAINQSTSEGLVACVRCCHEETDVCCVAMRRQMCAVLPWGYRCVLCCHEKTYVCFVAMREQMCSVLPWDRCVLCCHEGEMWAVFIFNVYAVAHTYCKAVTLLRLQACIEMHLSVMCWCWHIVQAFASVILFICVCVCDGHTSSHEGMWLRWQIEPADASAIVPIPYLSLTHLAHTHTNCR